MDELIIMLKHRLNKSGYSFYLYKDTNALENSDSLTSAIYTEENLEQVINLACEKTKIYLHNNLTEMIVRAAIILRGKIYVGKSHDEIRHYREFLSHLYKKEGEEIEGFVTNKGEFVNRRIAAKIAYEAGQIKETCDSLENWQIS